MIENDVMESGREEYHPAMLIVKTRREAARNIATAAARGEALLNMPGFSTLALLDRARLVRRIVSLGRAVRTETMEGVRAPSSAVSMMTAASHESDPNADVSIVEVEHDSDVENLRRTLAGDPGVEFVSRVPIRYALGKPRMPTAVPPTGVLWNLQKIRWAEARAISKFVEPEDVKVAVLDTGVDRNHPDLKELISGYVHSYPDAGRISSDQDLVGHGTHVTGTIAANLENSIGVNGICKCKLLFWKVFSDEATYFQKQNQYSYVVDPVMYYRALASCVEDNVDVVNLSIGGQGRPSAQESNLFRMLFDQGTVVVAAMGNERQNGSPNSFPAKIAGVIAVGATTIDDSVARFSNRGDHIALSAPGVAIWSTLPTYQGQFGFEAFVDANGNRREGRPLRRDMNYDAWDGTSMATPHVTAAVAIRLAAIRKHMGGTKKIPPSVVRASLTRTAQRVAGMAGADFHPDYGAGRLDLFALVQDKIP